MKNKILSGLYGGLIGDSMGSATGSMSYRTIENKYNGYVKSFHKPTEETISFGKDAGEFTGAFSIFYYLIEDILEEGEISETLALKSLLRWSENEDMLKRYGGLTTKNVIGRYKNDKEALNYWDYSGRLGNKLFKSHFYALSSNGAITKALAAGLLYPMNIEKSVESAIKITMSSHDDYYSIIGAACVAAAVSHAFEEDVTVESILKKAIDGGVYAEKIMPKNALEYPGPSVIKRIILAKNIAISYPKEIVYKKLADIIGSGPAVSETLPVALGIIIANDGKTMESIYDAVNIGDETSKIAMICGCITGVLNGLKSFNESDIEFVKKTNGIDLEKIASKIVDWI